MTQSILGHGKLGSRRWDQNKIMGFEDKSELIAYVKDRFSDNLDNSLSLSELMMQALSIAENYHDNSRSID